MSAPNPAQKTDADRERLVGVGAGRLASAMLPALHHAGIKIEQVFSRDASKAQAIGRLVNAQGIDSLHELDDSATLYLIAVPDDALPEVAAAVLSRIAASANTHDRALPPMLVHCSGSASLQALYPNGNRPNADGQNEDKPNADGQIADASGALNKGSTIQHNIPYGVFYPVQSFSYGIVPDFSQIPICLTGSTPQAEDRLARLAAALGSAVHRLSDAQRASLHLAAVLVNNFPNHLFALAAQWMQAHDLPFSMLQPLLLETARKATLADPRGLQTGPALRGDEATLARHLEALRHQPDLAELYRLMTSSIQRMAKA
ncbi:MAG: DUF2520 domain-containing protein [Bacteroidetes bacterium]|nr:DUF2520 domain-containing protein [Bacteroidota bacterium]